MARYWYSYIGTDFTDPAIYAPGNYTYRSTKPTTTLCPPGVAKPCAIYSVGTDSGSPASISPRLQTYIGQTTVYTYFKYFFKKA